MQTLKILTIDDHPIYLHGMWTSFGHLPIVQKMDQCRTYDEMFDKLKEDEPHLVFLELSLAMSRYDGLRICREITKRYKNVFTAVLTRHNSPKLIKEARECGARAFFDKNTTDPETLRSFLNDFVCNKIPGFYTKVAGNRSKANDHHFKQDCYELMYTLTRREREVMTLVVEGLDHSEIGTALNITYETYKTHRTNVLRKLGLRNDVELTRFALSNNLCAGEECPPPPSPNKGAVMMYQ
jgi:DNA-binding NarL/FixJ family response regulator